MIHASHVLDVKILLVYSFHRWLMRSINRLFMYIILRAHQHEGLGLRLLYQNSVYLPKWVCRFNQEGLGNRSLRHIFPRPLLLKHPKVCVPLINHIIYNFSGCESLVAYEQISLTVNCIQ